MKVSFVKKFDPQSKDGMEVKYAPAKRTVSKAIWWSVLAVVFAPFAWLLVTLGYNWFVVSSPGVVFMPSFPVTATEQGTITKVFVAPGDSVKAGAPLFSVESRKTAAVTNAIASMKAELEALGEAGMQRARSSRAEPRYANEVVAHLEGEARAYKKLMASGAATRAEYNQAEERLLSAKNDFSAAALPADDTTNAVRALYLKKYIKVMENSISQPTMIFAPRAGTVENVFVSPGYDAMGDNELLRITDLHEPYFVAYVSPENYDDRVHPGAQATVRIPGKGRSVEAHVVDRPTNANNLPGGLGDSLLGGRRSIIVFLKPNTPLLTEELVNGMPVSIQWGVRFFK